MDRVADRDNKIGRYVGCRMHKKGVNTQSFELELLGAQNEMHDTKRSEFGKDDQKFSLRRVKFELLLRHPNEDAGKKNLDMQIWIGKKRP